MREHMHMPMLERAHPRTGTGTHAHTGTRTLSHPRMRTHMSTRTCACACSRPRTHKQAHTRSRRHTRPHVHTYKHMHAHTQTHAHLHPHTFKCTCTRAHACSHTFTHACARTRTPSYTHRLPAHRTLSQSRPYLSSCCCPGDSPSRACSRSAVMALQPAEADIEVPGEAAFCIIETPVRINLGSLVIYKMRFLTDMNEARIHNLILKAAEAAQQAVLRFSMTETSAIVFSPSVSRVYRCRRPVRQQEGKGAGRTDDGTGMGGPPGDSMGSLGRQMRLAHGSRNGSPGGVSQPTDGTGV